MNPDVFSFSFIQFYSFLYLFYTSAILQAAKTLNREDLGTALYLKTKALLGRNSVIEALPPAIWLSSIKPKVK